MATHMFDAEIRQELLKDFRTKVSTIPANITAALNAGIALEQFDNPDAPLPLLKLTAAMRVARAINTGRLFALARDKAFGSTSGDCIEQSAQIGAALHEWADLFEALASADTCAAHDELRFNLECLSAEFRGMAITELCDLSRYQPVTMPAYAHGVLSRARLAPETRDYGNPHRSLAMYGVVPVGRNMEGQELYCVNSDEIIRLIAQKGGPDSWTRLMVPVKLNCIEYLNSELNNLPGLHCGHCHILHSDEVHGVLSDLVFKAVWNNIEWRRDKCYDQENIDYWTKAMHASGPVRNLSSRKRGCARIMNTLANKVKVAS